MIGASDVARAEWIIDNSRVVQILVDGYRTNNRGRKPNVANIRLLLIGLYLSVAHKGSATLTSAHRTLLRLPLTEQIRLGVIRQHEGEITPTVTLTDFYNIELRLCTKLAYGELTAFDVTVQERERRRSVIGAYCDSLMNLFDLQWDTFTAALDATGVWSWGKGFSNAERDRIRAELLGIEPAVASLGAGEVSAPDAARGPEADADDVDDAAFDSPRRRDLDGAWGIKTSKSGKDERFFGYHEHTFVQVPDSKEESDTVPPLITAFELTPASTDVVEVSLSLIDRMLHKPTTLIVDRHYHFKRAERWLVPLRERGIDQVHDLRVDEHGFVESGRLRWAAGWAHCPATPDAFGEIPRPGPQDGSAGRDAFRVRIGQREAFAMRPHSRPAVDGKLRVGCPALAAKVGCPLRPGTEATAIELGLPLVTGAPNAARDGEPLPDCCVNNTVTVRPPAGQLKLQQPRYWGSAEWERIWNRRTYVEGSYGIRKNPGAENMRRGHFQVFGLVWAHIVMGMVNTSHNVNALRRWHDRHPEADLGRHPLLVGFAETTVGYVAIDTEAARELFDGGDAA
jgi:hypothetical protein